MAVNEKPDKPGEMTNEAVGLLRELRRNVPWTGQYEQDLLLAFWLAVDKENIYLAQRLMDFDLSIRVIVTICMLGEKEFKPRKTKSKSDGRSATKGGASAMPSLNATADKLPQFAS